ncbi:hypothetical protein ABZY06_20795 [Streptomyces sp. NPDC006540]
MDLADGWKDGVEIIIDAPAEAVAQRLPRNLGRQEPMDAATTR